VLDDIKTEMETIELRCKYFMKKFEHSDWHKSDKKKKKKKKKKLKKKNSRDILAWMLNIVEIFYS
jgi:hypothetical protein